MDDYPTFKTFAKMFQTKCDEKDKESASILLKKMKMLHGRSIETIYNVSKQNEDNKLEVLSILSTNKRKMEDKLLELDEKFDEVFNVTQEQNQEQIMTTQEASHQSSEGTYKSKIPSLVLFFADWCPPCKAFLPTWNKFIEVNKRNDINIVKYSCVKYDKECQGFGLIRSFPTIILHKPKEKNIVFDQSRDMENIIEFVKQNAGIELTSI